MSAIVKTAVDPKFALIIALVLSMPALRADEKPPDAVFQHSPLELTIKTPPSFKPTRSTTGYLPTPVGNVPYRDQSWPGKTAAVAVRRVVMPEVWWQKIAPQFFAEAKLNLPGAPNVKLISERDYSISGCAAHSFVISTPGSKPAFWRVDYLLAKPDLHQVMYNAESEVELSGTTCKKLYESISLMPKSH
ncbi:MAG TPA: hypothetical protein VGQ70_03915 [Candidatus Udaeobacter sp.]|nr:hypothetical protein [Candidatus Udaeobacter sp.]